MVETRTSLELMPPEYFVYVTGHVNYGRRPNATSCAIFLAAPHLRIARRLKDHRGGKKSWRARFCTKQKRRGS